MNRIVVSPVSGQAISLDKVQDEMFSQRMLGDGAAVIPDQKEVVSPAAGKITMIYETQHAIGIETENGDEILLHIGIDTVMLNGVPFSTQVKIGDEVKAGDLLTIVDWDYIKKKDCDPVVVILAVSKKISLLKEDIQVGAQDALFEILA